MVPFIEYAVRGVVDGLVEQIKIIDEHQWAATWKDLVYSKFRNKTTKTSHRQRQIALDLWKRGPEGVLKTAVRKISVEVAEFYSGKTQRTIDLDLKALIEMGLLQLKDRNHVRCCFSSTVKQLRPIRKTID